MIDDRNFAERSEEQDTNKTKKFFKLLGIGALSLVLAIFTILVINVSN